MRSTLSLLLALMTLSCTSGPIGVSPELWPAGQAWNVRCGAELFEQGDDVRLAWYDTLPCPTHAAEVYAGERDIRIYYCYVRHLDRDTTQRLLQHELGHVLGFDHTHTGGLMDPDVPSDRIDVCP